MAEKVKATTVSKKIKELKGSSNTMPKLNRETVEHYKELILAEMEKKKPNPNKNPKKPLVVSDNRPHISTMTPDHSSEFDKMMDKGMSAEQAARRLGYRTN